MTTVVPANGRNHSFQNLTFAILNLAATNHKIRMNESVNLMGPFDWYVRRLYERFSTFDEFGSRLVFIKENNIILAIDCQTDKR